MTAAVRCAPPQNRPTPQENQNCSGYLRARARAARRMSGSCSRSATSPIEPCAVSTASGRGRSSATESRSEAQTAPTWSARTTRASRTRSPAGSQSRCSTPCSEMSRARRRLDEPARRLTDGQKVRPVPEAVAVPRPRSRGHRRRLTRASFRRSSSAPGSSSPGRVSIAPSAIIPSMISTSLLGADDRERPVAERTDPACRDVGVLRREIRARLATLARPVRVPSLSGTS